MVPTRGAKNSGVSAASQFSFAMEMWPESLYNSSIIFLLFKLVWYMFEARDPHDGSFVVSQTLVALAIPM
jgi:hypothetical protein